MPPADENYLAPGTVLHIKGYSSRNHPPKNKYLVVIGNSTDNETLGFLISSQMFYLQQETHKSEVVRIPHNATNFLRKESIIQCFEMERLETDSLMDGIERKEVSKCGKLPTKYLHQIRDTVCSSNLLAQQDIEEAEKVLPHKR